MQAILDFFTGTWDLISSLADFAISFIGDLVYVIKLTGAFISQIPSYFGWLPSTYVSLIVTIFSVVAIYKIIGREG